MWGVGGRRVETNKNANNGLSLESGIIGDGDFLPSILVNSPHTLQQTDITLRTFQGSSGVRTLAQPGHTLWQ